MLVRPAAPSDVPALLDLMEAFNACEQIQWRRDTGEAPLRALLGDPGLGLVVVADLEGAAVGYAVVKVIRIMPSEGINQQLVKQMQQHYTQSWSTAEGLAYYETLKSRYQAQIKVPRPSSVQSKIEN